VFIPAYRIFWIMIISINPNDGDEFGYYAIQLSIWHYMDYKELDVNYGLNIDSW